MDNLEKILAKYPQHIREGLLKMFPQHYHQSPFLHKFLENEDNVHDLLKREPEHHIVASPLVDVFSVKIFNYAVGDANPYEIYGSIKLTDGEGAIFTLYNRNDDMAETICNGDPLTLVFEKGRAITPSNVITLKIDLKARIGDRVVHIVNECQSWDYNFINDFDKVKNHEVNGVQGSAILEYVIYRYAVFTTVDVLLVEGNDKDESCKSVNIYGNIVAVCGRNYSTTLFDKKQNDYVVVEYGKYIDLSKHVVVVPAWFSSFTIHASLWNADTNQKIVDKGEKFGALHYGWGGGRIEGIDVKLKWSHAYMQPKVDETSSLAKNYKATPDQQSLSSAFSAFFSEYIEPMEVMEVFSMSVFSNSDEELNLWGSIRVTNNPQNFLLFNKDKKSPERLLPNQTISITSPLECIVNPGFRVNLDLEDVDGRVISMGYISWCDQTFKTPISWFRKPLCSIVRGDDGCFAAVHYSIFSAALQATVKMYLIDKNSCMKDTKVVGCVRAQYSDYKYVTIYDKEFYRRKLFTRQIEESPMEFVNSRIKLSESAIAVAKRSTLIVDVNLKVISQNNDMMQVSETFEKQLEFRADMGHKAKLINRRSHYFAVSVEWSGVD